MLHAPEAELLAVRALSAEARPLQECQSPVLLIEVERLLEKRQPALFQEYEVRGMPGAMPLQFGQAAPGPATRGSQCSGQTVRTAR